MNIKTIKISNQETVILKFIYFKKILKLQFSFRTMSYQGSNSSSEGPDYGLKGDTGPEGPEGERGRCGKRGRRGKRGHRGYYVQGFQGVPGQPGPPGLTGPSGSSGSCKIFEFSSPSTSPFTLTTLTPGNKCILYGSVGITGSDNIVTIKLNGTLKVEQFVGMSKKANISFLSIVTSDANGEIAVTIDFISTFDRALFKCEMISPGSIV